MKLADILEADYSERSKDIRKRCVAKAMKKGWPEDRAWAICMSSLMGADRIYYDSDKQKWVDREAKGGEG